jgi:hypothetical protein
MPHQEPLTIVADLKPEGVEAARAVLEQMRTDPAHNEVLPFGRLPNCHFGRLLITEPARDLRGRPIKAHLFLMSDCDGSAHAQLAQIVDVAGDGLHALLQHCEGYAAQVA